MLRRLFARAIPSPPTRTRRFSTMVASKRTFSLESSVPFALPATTTEIKTYKHDDSNFRLVFCPVPGPLCSASIVVPTLAEGDEGLAHTLEHLVFCGSTLNGYTRGFLDSLANRCLSTGTNAYTTEDHTAYTITTAGSEGMLEILPVFLEHVLFPTLSEEQFVTEVHHLDGDAKHQGVVYCEMAGRENTEADVLDLTLRRLLFQNETTYSRECGGLTHEIAKLKNEEIVRYHKKFYHLDNLTTIICGQVPPSEVFKKLAEVDGLLEAKPASEVPAKIPSIVVPKMPGGPGHVIKETVPFPCSDEELGSIAYAWRGPPSEDITTIVALDVLFRYLHETSASPFSQAFVERETPFASQVDFEVRGYVETAIELVFSGVPLSNADQDDASDSMEIDGDEEGSESEYSDEENGSESGSDAGSTGPAEDLRLFEPGVYHDMMMKVLLDFLAESESKQSAIRGALSRHRRKILEALEEEPLEACASYILPDVIRHSLASSSTLKDTRAQNGRPVIGTRATILKTLEELADKPMKFWSDLVTRWLVDVPKIEVHMIPDRHLAEKLAKKEQDEQKERAKALGAKGLAHLKAVLDDAVEKNRVILTPDAVAKMPPVADVTRCDKLESVMEVMTLGDTGRPFDTFQVVQTNTVFSHLRLGMHTHAIPEALRPYLVLFQELLFQSSLTLQTPTGTTVVDYREVVRQSADLFVSYEAAVGFGNEIWNASWLSEVFMLSASAERKDWTKMVRFLAQVLMCTTFTEERLVTIAKNLLSEITELKRDGPDMLSAVCTRVTLPFDKQHKAVEGNRNDLYLTLFRQEGFLRGVIEKIKAGGVQQVVEALEQIKSCLINPSQPTGGPGFAQIAVQDGSPSHLVEEVVKIWDEEVALYNKTHGSSGSTAVTRAAQQSPFPYPRQPYDASSADLTFGNAVLIPIPGVTTTFLAQIVPCDVLRPHPHPDYYAVTLLAEILTRAEGPLYLAIRGQGYAYDASIHISLWTGQLSFELYESSEPHRALLEFYGILNKLQTDAGFEELCSDFHIETARASVAYKAASAKSTSGGLIVGALRSVLRGFKTLEEEEVFHKELYKVDKTALKRVLHTYFLRFFDTNRYEASALLRS
ncbi:uncharacterized protein EV422DRAFT_511122 [Fimicolochytrium jonesii]|uniref:uncharacterized protein n=1 Tax=Fimicolochytrium jonesii TaxID=1396493 RepID=UPI0022FDB79A|nr:uncharacterized protein EV422DRAFT_511122 [Fimicolochytrium jonesii]KAI8826708.1 hypothetical protein EV422DRAFT_511122 [Fimicolochytrium jonesii]